jgi:hypothetical protein
LFFSLLCHSGAPRSGEPGIHSHKPLDSSLIEHIVVMDSGPRFARPE